MSLLSQQVYFIIRFLPAYPALIFHLTFETDFVEWLKKVFVDFIRVFGLNVLASRFHLSVLISTQT